MPITGVRFYEGVISDHYQMRKLIALPRGVRGRAVAA